MNERGSKGLGQSHLRYVSTSLCAALHMRARARTSDDYVTESAGQEQERCRMRHEDARLESDKKTVLFKVSPVTDKNCLLGVTMEFPSLHILKMKEDSEGLTAQSESLCPSASIPPLRLTVPWP